jgi:hypothetical protein
MPVIPIIVEVVQAIEKRPEKAIKKAIVFQP